MLSYSDIQAASVRLRDHVLRTPCVESQTLSHIVGAQVFLKFENLQFTASFKERGACTRLQLLSAEEKAYVATALRVNEEPEYDEISISGQDLVKYIKNSNSSSRMYSSAKITRQEEGKGLTISIVTPDNITQVTSEMYATAMLTAGITEGCRNIAEII